MKTKTTRLFGISLGILLALSFVLAPFSAAASGDEGDGLATSLAESLVEDGEPAGEDLLPEDPADTTGDAVQAPGEAATGTEDPGQVEPADEDLTVAEDPATDEPDDVDSDETPAGDIDPGEDEEPLATPADEPPADDQPTALPARDRGVAGRADDEDTDTVDDDSEASESSGAYVSASTGLPSRAMPAMAMLPFPEGPADYSGEAYVNSFADLQTKVAAATQGDIIVITGNIDFTGTITVDGGKEILIDGGGHEFTGSTGARMFDVQDATLELRDVTMDGDGTAAGISASNAALVLADVTAEAFSAEFGGFLYATNSHVSATNVRLAGNYASKDGGAVWMRGGSLWLVHSVIDGNTAGRNGGGVYVYETDVQSAGMGLGLTNNTAAQYGGGMYIDGAADGLYHTVTYDVNGGEATTPVQHIYVFSGHVYLASADALGFAPISTLLEGTFEGWNTAPDGTGTDYAPGQLEELHGDLTLYAKWMYTSEPPAFDTVTEDNTEVSGTGIAGSTVEVTFPDGTTGTALVDENGNWNMPVVSSLAAGQMLYATQTEPGKRVSAQVVTIVQAGIAKSDPPAFNEVYENDGYVSGTGIAGSTITVTFPDGTVVECIVNNSGNWTVNVPGGVYLMVGEMLSATQTEVGKLVSDPAGTTVMARPVAQQSEPPVIFEIYDDDTEIRGSGIANSEITVRLPSGIELTTTVDSSGYWTVPVNQTLVASQTVEAWQTEMGKTPSDTVSEMVQERPESAPPTIDTPITPTSSTITGTGVPYAVIHVTFPGDINEVTYVDGNGYWTVNKPGSVTLYENNVVMAAQEETGKRLSQPVFATVLTNSLGTPVRAGVQQVRFTRGYATLGAATAFVKLLDDEVSGNAAGLDGGGIYTVHYKYLYTDGVLFGNNTVTANPAGIKLDMVNDSDLVGLHDTQMVGLAGLSAAFNPAGSGNTRFAYNSIDVNYQAPAFYTITYKPGEGTGNEFTDSVRAGGSTTVASAGGFTAPAGRKFSHWASGSATYKPGAGLTPTGDMTLTAVWVRDDSQYANVTYRANGGEAASGGFADGHSESVLKNTKYTVKANGYTRDGYSFTGWNTKADGTGTAYAAGKSVTVRASLTLYAQWKKDEAPDPSGPDSKPDESKPDSSKPDDSSKPGSSSGGGAGSRPDSSVEAGSSSSRRGYASSSEAPAPSRGGTPSETPPPPTPITTVAPSTSAASSSASSSTSSSTSSAAQSSSASTSSPALAETSTPAPGGDGEGGDDAGEAAPSVVNDTPAQGEAASSPADLPATATREEIIDATGSIDLFGNELPLGALNLKGGWSLISLLVSVLSIMLAVVYGIRTLVGRGNSEAEDDDANAAEAADGRTVYTRREKQDQARAERREDARRRVHPRDIIAMVLGLLPVVVFLFMNDLSNPMVLMNRSTLICAILALLHIATFVAGQVLRRRQEQDEESPALDEG